MSATTTVTGRIVLKLFEYKDRRTGACVGCGEGHMFGDTVAIDPDTGGILCARCARLQEKLINMRKNWT